MSFTNIRTRKFVSPQLGFQSLVILGSKITGAAVSYVFVVLLARVLAPDAFGQVSFFLAAASLTAAFAGMGYPLLLLRVLPGLLTKNLSEKAEWLLHRSVKAVLRSSLAAAAALFIVMTVANHFGFFDGFGTLAVLAGIILVPCWTFSELISHAWRARQRMLLAFLPRDVIWKIISGAGVLGLVKLGVGVGAAGALAILSSMLAVVAYGQYRALPRVRGGQSFEGATNGLGPFWISSASAMMLAHADTFIVAMMLGAGPAGQYFAASRLVQVLALFMTAGNQALAPTIASVPTGDGEEAARLARRNAQQVFFPTLVGAAVLWTFAPQVLSLFGPGFPQVAPALRLLVLAVVLNAGSGAGDVALMMAGHQKFAARISLAAMVIALPIMLVGVGLGGLVGLSWSIVLLTVLRKTALWHLSRQHLGGRVDALSWRTS